MGSQSGALVITKSGLKGRTYTNSPRINGKIPVYLLDDNGRLKYDDKGNPLPAMLCTTDSLTLKGYID